MGSPSTWILDRRGPTASSLDKVFGPARNRLDRSVEHITLSGVDPLAEMLDVIVGFMCCWPGICRLCMAQKNTAIMTCITSPCRCSNTIYIISSPQQKFLRRVSSRPSHGSERVFLHESDETCGLPFRKI